VSETVVLANGARVPKSCVDALDHLDKVWPGATFSHARPAIVLAVLKQYLRLVKHNKGAEVSQDNGFILRKNKAGKFVLQGYWASAEAYPTVEDAPEECVHETLEAAIAKFEELEDCDYPSEYGLTVQLSTK
jgi:hypothetical protein